MPDLKTLFHQFLADCEKNGVTDAVNSGLEFIIGRWASLVTKPVPKSWIWKTRQLYYDIKYDHPPDLCTQLTIDPNSIKYRSIGRRFSHNYHMGTVMDGSWDRERNKFENHPIFNGIKSRYLLNKPWKDTEYVTWAENKIKLEGECFGHRKIDTFIEKRCSYVDRLYQDIHENGFRDPNSGVHDNNRDTDEKEYNLLVNIGRNGEFILYDGHHRLAMAKILEINKIPVHVLIRHKEWQKKREHLVGSSIECTHPDLC